MLATQVAHKNEFVTQSQPYMVNGTLIGVPVVVVAMRGDQPEAVKAQVQMLQQAGAEAPESCGSSPPGRYAAATRRSSPPRSASHRDPTALRRRGPGALATRFAAGRATPANVAPTGSPTPPFTDGLTALTDAGFVALERVGEQGRGLDLADVPRYRRAWPAGRGPRARNGPAPMACGSATALLVAEACRRSSADVCVDGTDGPEPGRHPPSPSARRRSPARCRRSTTSTSPRARPR